LIFELKFTIIGKNVKTKGFIMRKKNKAVIKYLLIYGIIASLWIFTTDQLLLFITETEQQLSILQTLKGFLFILVSLSYMYVGVKKVSQIYEQEHDTLVELAELYLVSNEFIVVTDEEYNVIKANPAFLTFFNKGLKELEKKTLFHNIFLTPKKGFDFTRDKKGYKSWEDEVEYFCEKRKQHYILKMNLNKIKSHKGIRYLLIFDDITQNKQTENNLSFMANHDDLTKLPNRKMVQEKFNQYSNNGQKVALVYFDLDGFKEINDLKGHLVGDKLLKDVSNTLMNTIDKKDIIARVGGDEFLIIMENIESKEQVEKKLKYVQQAIAIANEQTETSAEYTVSATMGVCLFPDDGLSIDAVLSRADLALQQAKQKKKGSYLFYNQQMSVELENKTFILNELKRAFEGNEFFLEYQPKIDSRNNRVTGAEALVRWKNKGKMIRPDQFISIAENAGYANDLFEIVFTLALKNMVDFKLFNKGEFKQVSINVSAKQFSNQESIDRMRKIILRNKKYAENIILEVTESCIMENIESTIKTLTEFRDLGYGVSIDDFGTGYSSLSTLRDLPITELKIDRTFIKDIPNQDDEVMIKMINDMAQGLDLNVVAEGVETKSQLDILKTMNCNIIQGFYFSKPVPIEELKEFVLARN
jgi:diguanylate cyclase (GGDEF)-like protein/PAS domain S-box-containing protein